MGKKCKTNKTVLDLDASHMRTFFLANERYFTLKIPTYFCFTELLEKLYQCVENADGKDMINLCRKAKDKCINYEIMVNKNKNFDWRKFQLIHPFLYVCLVRVLEIHWEKVRARFKEFKQDKIICAGIPIVHDVKPRGYTKAVILNWWSNCERASIRLSMEYSYWENADIANCYNSVYTHAISWALHNKDVAKGNKKNKQLFGNVIDELLRCMHYGQTNGIPTGSVLMDFIAELVLGYIDTKLAEKIKGYNCKIIRYRDDYKIFTKNYDDAEKILKILSETLSDFGFKLNPSKTSITGNLIDGVFKKDKLGFLLTDFKPSLSQKYLILIDNFGQKFPNSGQLVKLLSQFRHKLEKCVSRRFSENQIEECVAIVANIANNHSKTYPVCMNIIGFLINKCSSDKLKKDIIEKVKNKLSSKMNCEWLQIWMQRLTLRIDSENSYKSKLCNMIIPGKDSASELFDVTWLLNDLKKIFQTPIIDREILKKMKPVMNIEETDDFNSYPFDPIN